MRDEDAFSRNVGDRQRDVFRMFVGAGLRITRAALSAATGIPSSTLADYASGSAIPLHNLNRLLKALPPEAGNMLIEPSGFRLCPIDQAETNWNALGAEAAGLVQEICIAGVDGIDHSEDARLRKRTRELIAKAQGAVAA